MMKHEAVKKHYFILISILTVLVVTIVAGGFILWASEALGPAPEALSALQNTDKVKIVSNASWIAFEPLRHPVKTGFIFYPGGKVEFRSYAPALQSIAEQGYLVVLPNMPLNLAFLDPNKANQIIQSFPEVVDWVLGGHSLGGAMAATYVATHADRIKGLVLWAAYPANTDSLRQKGIKVLMVFGTQDGLVTREKLDATRELLPLDTLWVPIEGGNHAQFGFYGQQPGDNQALISALEQQKQAVKATLDFLSTLSK